MSLPVKGVTMKERLQNARKQIKITQKVMQLRFLISPWYPYRD